MYIFQNRVKSAAFKRCVEFSRLALFFCLEDFMYLLYADDSGVTSFRNFEYNDDTYYSIIKDCFDKEKNLQHGLYLLEKNSI